jgi:hypothetical protein
MNTSPSRRGGILMGLLITAATLVCVAMIVGFQVARSVHVNTVETGGGKDVSIQTPAGSFSIHAHDNAGTWFVDVPPYPGARQMKSNGGGAEFEWTSDDGREQKSFAVAGGEMITSDSAGKVFDYYHEKLPAWIVSHKRDGQIELKEPREGDSRRFIVIHEKFDGTHIGVASIGAPAAN